MEFPRLVFKNDGPNQRPGGTYDHTLAKDQAEMDALLGAGWSATLPEALDPNPKAQDDGQPTRAELEAKATELGVKFDGRIKDKTLADKIAVALEEQKDEA